MQQGEKEGAAAGGGDGGVAGAWSSGGAAVSSTVQQSSSGCCWEEGSEEELSVLPRHTKVVVTGNNRTKSVLVGLQGVVKKAVGLGGWHWLVLTNGIEVKLQRNALSVIEAPTGHEEDDDGECDNVQWQCSDLASDDTQKYQRPKQRHYKSSGSAHKAVSKSSSLDSHSMGSLSPPRGPTVICCTCR
ncbi:unnamed protein product [Victoria cruziana]